MNCNQYPVARAHTLLTLASFISKLKLAVAAVGELKRGTALGRTHKHALDFPQKKTPLDVTICSTMAIQSNRYMSKVTYSTFNGETLFTADILTCHSRESTGGMNINDSSVPSSVPARPPLSCKQSPLMFLITSAVTCQNFCCDKMSIRKLMSCL